jgi:hypothetical protein
MGYPQPARWWRLVPDGPSAPTDRGSAKQRLRRFARDFAADRMTGRLGPRILLWPRRVKAGGGRVTVLADTVDALHDALARDLPPLAIRRLTVRIAWFTAPDRGWSGRIGPLPGVLRQTARFPRSGRGPVSIDIRLGQPVPLKAVLTAAAATVRPVRAQVSGGGHGPVRAPAPAAVANRPRFDERRVNPRGRRADAYDAQAPWFLLDLADEPGLHRGGPVPWRWAGARRWRRGSGAELPWPTVSALRGVAAVRCLDAPGNDPVAEASLLAQLAATGVVLPQPNLDDTVAALLAPELLSILDEPLPDGAGPLEMETRSVRQRRAALRGHGLASAELPSVSAILATKRSEYLPAILRAVAGQTYPNLEIVLCLHGIELPDDCRDLIAGCGRAVELVRVPGDVRFGAALGFATARASGDLVTKIDDDDTYGPEHVWDLVLARRYSGATLVGKGIEFVHLADAKVTVRRHSGKPESDATHVAGGTMLIGRGELDELGGWRPVPRSVDRGLLDRLIRAGAPIYRTHPLGYLYRRGGHGHTWQTEHDFFLQAARQRWDGLIFSAEFGTLSASARSELARSSREREE